jgi:hypothetical protein
MFMDGDLRGTWQETLYELVLELCEKMSDESSRL